ncbi:MAG: HAMP domain-containing sensor histidine kinase [Gemmatimonadetes bacterium]|nr:HAMP domain-containing sensor histidine kinase [Gemmatimonadota bacterium]
MKGLSFRARLFAILALFAVVPAVVITFAWGGALTQFLPLMAGKAAWDTVSNTGERAVSVARRNAASNEESRAIDDHEGALANARTRSAQFELITERAPSALVLASLILVAVLTFAAARVAGHLTRQLTRPLDEVVAWTAHIGHGEALPAAEARGAPEFDVLRAGMQRMAAEIEAGRSAALEAERLTAMRETARQVAHELKNPLTPIRFAVARLRGHVAPELVDSVAVLDTETARLEQMARSFAQFGRLPDGPVAEIDVGELVANAVRTSVPNELKCTVRVEPGLSLMGRHGALGRALSNILLNAVEACGMSGRIDLTAGTVSAADRACVEIVVRDNGPGIEASKLGTIWDPYVTHKAGGTGLGLAIVRQTIAAHDGTVVAESSPGEGTAIRITLPAGEREPAQSLSNPETRHPGARDHA